MRIGLTFFLLVYCFQLLGQKQDSLAIDTTVAMGCVEVIYFYPNHSKTKLDSIENIKGGFVSIAEVLSEKSELFVRDYGSGALSTISFRGLGAAHSKINWNGVSINSSMNGTSDLSLLNTEGINSITISNGAASLLDGSSSLGGSVNLYSNVNFDSTNKLSITQSVGSFQTYSTSVLAKKSTKKWFAQASYSYVQSENNFNYVNPEKADYPTESMQGASYFNQNGTLILGYKINNKHSISSHTLVQYGERNLPYTTFQNSNFEFQKDEQFLSMLSLKSVFGVVSNNFKVGVRSSTLNYRNANIDLESNSDELNYFVQDRMNYRLFSKVKVNSTFMFDNFKAYNSKYGETKERNQFQMVHKFSSDDQKKFRYDLTIKTQLANNVSIPLMPSVGAGYRYREWLHAKANISYHAAIPSLNDLYWGEGGNPNLNPEKGISAEAIIAGKTRVKRVGVKYKVTAYYNNINDWILWQPSETGIWTVSNVDEVTASGVETNLSLKHSFLSFESRYSFNKTINAEGNQLVYVPENRFDFKEIAKFKGVELGIQQQFVGKRFINSNNTGWLPSYWLVNASAKYRMQLQSKNQVNVGFNVYNLFDNPYQTIANRPMPEINYRLTVNLTVG